MEILGFVVLNVASRVADCYEDEADHRYVAQRSITQWT